jgi:hypothetical protein
MGHFRARDILEDLSIDENIILKIDLQEMVWGHGLG